VNVCLHTCAHTTIAKHSDSDRGRDNFRNNALYWYKVLHKVSTEVYQHKHKIRQEENQIAARPAFLTATRPVLEIIIFFHATFRPSAKYQSAQRNHRVVLLPQEVVL
jgi:hypothetical protein